MTLIHDREDLDALPDQTVIRDAQGYVLERGSGLWFGTGDEMSDPSPYLPVDVLYLPEGATLPGTRSYRMFSRTGMTLDSLRLTLNNFELNGMAGDTKLVTFAYGYAGVRVITEGRVAMKLKEAKTLADTRRALDTSTRLANGAKAVPVLLCPREGCDNYAVVPHGDGRKKAVEVLAEHIYSTHGAFFDIEGEADPR